MIKLDIRHNIAAVERSLGRLRDDIRTKVTVSAVNKLVDHARTLMTREIPKEFNVKQAYVRERLRIRRARAKQGAFAIEGSLIGGKDSRKRSANIIAFVERKVTLAEGRRRKKAGTQSMVFVKVLRKGAPKALPGAFIGNDGRTVFRRVGKGRLPIKPVQVIDVAQMFNARRIRGPVKVGVEKRAPVVFAQEARFYLQRFNKGGKA
jgi:hypothetical protein